MPLNKTALTTLDTTAYYQSVLNLGVKVYTNDINTSVLRFQITRNNFPVSLGKANVKAYIAIITSGKQKIVDDLKFEDELKGILSYTLPREVLAQTGEHTAQVYISVNGVSDVVVERKMTFEIEDDLINQIDASTKLNYIRMFDDLQKTINNRVFEIEKAIKSGDDYVKQMNTTLNDGKVALNALSDKLKTEVTEKGNEVLANSTNKITVKSDEAVSNIDKVSSNAVTTVTTKLNEFNKAVENKSFVTSNSLDTKIDGLNWQKYKLTEPNGDRIRISNIDPANLSTGFYQIWNTKNMPLGSDGNAAYWNVDVSQGLDTKQILAVLSGTGQTFIKNIHKGADLGWKAVTQDYDFSKFQKYALTDENGGLRYVNLSSDLEKLRALEGGSYYAVNVPISATNTTAGYINLERRHDNLTKKITFCPYNSNQVFIMRFYNTWGDWEAAYTPTKDTGWLPITLLNGVTEYGVESKPQYKLITNDGVNTLVLKGSYKNIVSPDTIVGSIPSNIASLLDRDVSFLQNCSVKDGLATFARFVLLKNGQLKMERTNFNPTQMKNTDWYPVDMTITF